MKGNRDMYYGNYQAGGFQEPNFMPNMQPQGYNINAQYQSYGPNAVPMPIPMNNMNGQTNDNGTYVDEYDQRITKLERQIRRIDQRLRKLENASANNNIDEDINIVDSNMYMI